MVASLGIDTCGLCRGMTTGCCAGVGRGRIAVLHDGCGSGDL